MVNLAASKDFAQGPVIASRPLAAALKRHKHGSLKPYFNFNFYLISINITQIWKIIGRGSPDYSCGTR